MRIGDLTCSLVNCSYPPGIGSPDLSLIAQLTDLKLEVVKRRLRRAHGNKLVRNIFLEEWPAFTSRLLSMTVALARDGELAMEIAAWTTYTGTPVTETMVSRRLGQLAGNVLVGNAFPQLSEYSFDEDEDEPSPTDRPASTPRGSPSASDPFADVTTDWSRPRKVSRLLTMLGHEPRARLRAELFQDVLADLSARGLEACIDEDSECAPLQKSAESPGIFAKLRLRRAATHSSPRQSPPTRYERPVRATGAKGPPVAESSNRLFGRYRVVERLEPGAMGEVFKVWDEETHALRFIKRVQINSKDHASLRREAQIYSKLMNRNFAHVVTVHEVERDEAYMGLVLDFAEGGTLQRHVPQVGLASSKEVKSIATQIGTGLRELHHLDVVHRDLKPANVLRHNAAWKLADFGIAKDTGVHGTTTFKGHFTPGYAAPEQINSTEATPSADVYSFGKVITLMLTGGTDPDQIRFPDWQYLVRRCTDRNPDERPSASEVLKEISRL